MRTSWLPYAALLVGIFTCFSWAKLVQENAVDERSQWPKVEEYVILPPAAAAPVVFGWLGRQTAADITWARALVYYGSSTIGESDFRYLNKFIDNVIALDPKFRKIYDWAASAVAWKQSRATVEEFRTSVRYLERAIEEFPDDWRLYQSLALRYAYDLNPETEEERQRYMTRAAELLERASGIPDARIELATMAANLRSLLGERNRALAELRHMILATDNAAAQQKLMIRYRAMLEDPAVADEIEAFKSKFNQRWQDTLPYASAELFVLLGEQPTKRVDLAAVAPIQDLLIVGLLGDGHQPLTNDQADQPE